MELEHYPAMTVPALEQIAAEAGRRWSLLGCTVIHRIGELRPGDNIVLVLAAAPHRQSALDATSFLIDWLKTARAVLEEGAVRQRRGSPGWTRAPRTIRPPRAGKGHRMTADPDQWPRPRMAASQSRTTLDILTRA